MDSSRLRSEVVGVALTVAIGIGGGMLASLLLYTLALVTQWRMSAPGLVVLLPALALLLSLLPAISTDTLRETLRTSTPMPKRSGTISFVGTGLSHLLGASVGREATALLMSAAFARSLARRFGATEDCRLWLRPALSAGFAGAVGAPWAAAVFGLEFEKPGGAPRLVLMCTLSAWLAHATTYILQAPHLQLPRALLTADRGQMSAASLKLALLIGVLAYLYTRGFSLVQKIFSPFWGATTLLLLFVTTDLWELQGLSLTGLASAFSNDASLSQALGKLAVTGLSLAAGFRGGEFIPLVFVGSHLGGWLLTGGAALGFGALFGALTRTPVACAILSAELFGWSLLPYTLVVGWGAFAILQGFRLAFAPRVGYP